MVSISGWIMMELMVCVSDCIVSGLMACVSGWILIELMVFVSVCCVC